VAKPILMDEFHLTVFVPPGLQEVEYHRIRRTLDGTRFHADLRRAVRDIFRQYPSLRTVRSTITR